MSFVKVGKKYDCSDANSYNKKTKNLKITLN